MTGPLRVDVSADGDALALDVRNVGDAVVRLWRQSNSWGWSLPVVHVGPDPDGPDGPAARLLRPGPRLWTRNFPSTVEVAPGASARYVLRAEDFDAGDLDAARPWAGQPLWVRGEIRSEPGTETAEYDVWTGVASGEAARLPPPHRWLQPAG